jgi:hypothetical protein
MCAYVMDPESGESGSSTDLVLEGI